MNRATRLYTLMLSLALPASAPAATFNVPADYPTIQAALSAAQDGDIVQVADGTYTGSGNRNLDFAGKAIWLRSQNGPKKCIIDCESSGRAVVFDDGETEDAVLSGFTITNGFAAAFGGAIQCINSSPTISNCILTHNVADAGGGAIFNAGGSPTVTDCRLEANSTLSTGGGMYDTLSPSPSTVTGCIFIGNSAGLGGGMYIDAMSVPPDVSDTLFCQNTPTDIEGTFTDNGNVDFCITTTIQAAINAATTGDVLIVGPGTYVENINFLGKGITVRSIDPTDPSVVVSTIIDGGGIGSVITCESGEGPDTILSGFVVTNGLGNPSFGGGGMFNAGSSPTVSHCTFTENSAGGSPIGGGGMLNVGGSPNVSYCAFFKNTAAHGGGMLNNSSDATVSDCTFRLNSASSSGGGMANGGGGSPTLTRCTFSANSAADGGGLLNDSTTDPILSRCTICANTVDQISGTFIDDGNNLIDPNCPPPALRSADLDGDGDVDAADLAFLLGNWGP